ncbi:response regulator [Nocardioides aequoreus]|uniref:response regulator n=1 Tax=Nocardioides aequoreus TaxID=397278 RepID=UPI0004C2F326|nr:response regulator [Nocardioides aequoreus]
MKILVTDDSRVMRQIVVRTLRQAGLGGHEVVEAENGRDALEKIRTEEPDVVLSDWNMPVMDGITLLATLRRRGHALPFGFVTSEGSPEMRARAEQVGADFVIAKPFTPDAFAEALAPVLGGR